MTRHPRLVVLGPPGAGCRSVGRALARTGGTAFEDLGVVVAEALGVQPHSALVEAGEHRYRQAETACATRLLHALAGRAEGGVLALGSGCLEQTEVLDALGAVRQAGGQVVALVAGPRCLATRNGLDAPRSVGLGAVYQQFTQMLRLREATCRELADLVVDTTATSVEEAAGQVLRGLVSQVRPGPS